jgi:hypothetical protein
MKKFNSIELGIPADMTYKGRTIKSLTDKTGALKSRDKKKAVKLIPDNDNKVEIKDAGTVKDGKLEFGTAEVEVPDAVVKRGRKVATLTPKTKSITSRKGLKSIRVRGTKENKVSILSKGQEVAVVSEILKKLDEAPIPKKDISALKAKFQMAFKRHGFKKAVEQMRDMAKKYAEKEKVKIDKENEKCFNEWFDAKAEISDYIKESLANYLKKYYYSVQGLPLGKPKFLEWEFSGNYYLLVEELYKKKYNYIADQFISRIKDFFSQNTIFGGESLRKMDKVVSDFIKEYMAKKVETYKKVMAYPEFQKEVNYRCSKIKQEWHRVFGFPSSLDNITDYAKARVERINFILNNKIETEFRSNFHRNLDELRFIEEWKMFKLHGDDLREKMLKDFEKEMKKTTEPKKEEKPKEEPKKEEKPKEEPKKEKEANKYKDKWEWLKAQDNWRTLLNQAGIKGISKTAEKNKYIDFVESMYGDILIPWNKEEKERADQHKKVVKKAKELKKFIKTPADLDYAKRDAKGREKLIKSIKTSPSQTTEQLKSAEEKIDEAMKFYKTLTEEFNKK